MYLVLNQVLKEILGSGNIDIILSIIIAVLVVLIYYSPIGIAK